MIFFYLLQTVALVRFVAFMVLVYLLLGLLVEVNSRKPDSQLKAFFRTLCSPITRPVSRLVTGGTSHRRVLGLSIGLVGALWVVSMLVHDALRG